VLTISLRPAEVLAAMGVLLAVTAVAATAVPDLRRR